MLDFMIDADRCTRCRQCVNDCPSRIISQKGDAVPSILAEKAGACIKCQHCLAVCPAGALSIYGRRPEESLPLAEDSFPSLEQMSMLVRGRRSVRQYRHENVDPALIHQVLTTLAYAPTGVNQCELTFTVIDDLAVMDRFQHEVMAGLQAAAQDDRIPARYGYLHSAVSWPYKYGVQLLFRNAPHALIVSAPPDAPCPDQDITATLGIFDLLAQSAGLGTVWWGMLPMILETVPTLKSFINLPPDHRYFGMLFGVPAVRYARTVQRDDAAIIRSVTG